MNEQVQKALIQLIDKSVNGMDSAVDFLQAETPDVIYQLLMWHGVYNFILFLIGVGLLCLIFPCYRRIKNTDWKDHPDEEQLVTIIFGVVTFVAGIFGVNILNLQWLKIWVAPKVWLIEYARALIQ